jgi:hypothetical protein
VTLLARRSASSAFAMMLVLVVAGPGVQAPPPPAQPPDVSALDAAIRSFMAREKVTVDLTIVVLTNRGFVWLTEILPAWISEPVPSEAAGSPPPRGRFEDGLFQLDLLPDGDRLRVDIDLIGPLVFVPAGPLRFVSRDSPATFLIRLSADGSRDTFEFDWGDVRSFAQRVRKSSPRASSP